MESLSSFKELPSLNKGLLLQSQVPSIGSELPNTGVTQMGINVTLASTLATQIEAAPNNDEATEIEAENCQTEQNISLKNIPACEPNILKQKGFLKEKFILKSTENSSTNGDYKTVEESIDDKIVTNDDISLSDDELYNLKQCRNRAYGKVNQKKRMHLNASLSQYILKEWLSVYPNSPLTGKQLVSAFESNLPVEETRKTPRGRKRKVSYSPTPPPEKLAKKNKSQLIIENEAHEELQVQDVSESLISDGISNAIISTTTHSDRQWTEAMLSNLMFCNQQALNKMTDLESEWHLLYPNSVLTARNLKSRLTVFQRTHSERSAPTKPMQEKVATQSASRPLARSRSLLVQEEAPPTTQLARTQSEYVPPVKKQKTPAETTRTNKSKSPISWTSEMVTDMFETLDIAREELDSTVNSVVNKRWHQLWLERQSTCSQVTRDNLYSRYLYHAKKASRVYTNKEQVKSPSKENSNSSFADEHSNGLMAEQSNEKDVTPNYSKLELSNLVGPKWTDEKLMELWKAKIFVEDRLRCIQDDYFYELLHERWTNQNPESKDSPEDLKATLNIFESNKEKKEAALLVSKKESASINSTDTKLIVESIVKEEKVEVNKPLELNGIKEENIKVEDIKKEPPIEDYDMKDDDDSSYECKEEPIEFPSVPRSKWVCPNHYIHVFYDDQDKSVECILTDQLLQMRNSLAVKFPGQDLTRPGKKPAGFARMLLSEWTRHYPGSQENTKTISMKIGRYDRAPQLLQQEAKGANGRINWTPAMLENIRTTRERAVEVVGSNGGPYLTKQWRMEWEELYPDLKVDWKQVISRYHYHYGGERRESVDGERSGRSSMERTPSAPPSTGNSDTEEGEANGDIRGFRQWTNSMQEDLLILRDILTQADPGLDPASKSFSRQLLSLFQDKHPHCMESARSLLSKLKDPSPQLVSVPSLETVKVEPEEPSPPPKPKSPKTYVAKKNPAVEIMSDIEGFTDWNLGMVRDFISCMDRARRKYADMKEVDPQMKLVPLLLSEWKSMYPQSQETVKTFLVRIRFLKTNKECIKARLGQHDLLPRMSQEETTQPCVNVAAATVEDEKDEVQEVTEEGTPVKFVWDANTMMPIVIATRAKAIAKQKKEAAQGRRVSYAKIWIKEFKKIYPTCPYTANNLSVHYWYWTSKETNQEKKDNTIKPPEIVEVEPNDPTTAWSEDQLSELKRVGTKVDAMLKDASNTNTKTMEFTKLLHSVWVKLHPQSKETEKSLSTVLDHAVSENKENVKQELKEEEPKLEVREKWTPKHNKALREIVHNLKQGNQYTRINVLKEWRRLFPRMDWDVLRSRIDDCELSLPLNIVEVREAKSAPEIEEIKVEPKQVEAEPIPSGLNARGQMRWTQQAVSDLLECHKLGLEAKNGAPDRKLADLVHQKFKQRHPYCPIAPNVLLTKCYILRSELKSGKLVLTDCKEDTGEKYRGEAGLRTWTMPMLEELVSSRKRAIGRRKLGSQGGNVGQVLGEVWLQEFQKVYPDYKSSKKNLFRKYKWWKQKRAEGEKGGVKSGKRILVEEEGDLFKEIVKGLGETTVNLPPFVSSKVIMLAQQWVENSQARDEMETEEGEIEKEMDGAEEAPGVSMITLPGGAVLVAKTGAGDSNKGRLTEPPDVSITLSQKSAQSHLTEPVSTVQGVSITLCSKPDWATVPANLVTTLTSLALPLALVPTLLAVYRDVRDTYKLLVQQGYVVSWARLLSVRLKTAWPGTAVTPTTMEQLVSVTLQHAGQIMQAKTVKRPGPIVQCTVELLQNIQNHMDRWVEVQIGWQNWLGEKLSAKQFVSLVELVCPGDIFNCEQMMCQAELCEVWTQLCEKGERESSLVGQQEIKVVRKIMKKGGRTTLSLDVVGRWLRRVKNIRRGLVKLSKRPRIVQKNPRLYWSLERVEMLKEAKCRGVERWTVSRKKRSSIGEMVVWEFRKMMGEAGKKVSDKHILGKLAQMQRREGATLGRIEEKEWEKLVRFYAAYLASEENIETVEFIDISEVATKHHSEDGLPDYSRDEDVIDFIREKEGGRKVANLVWSSGSLSILLKSREIARLRRADWESWAVSKHGTLHAAYSNPRVRVPKMEELLVEEWGRLRPNQAGISAWTLNSHLKKFDNLKRQLLDEQLEDRRIREAREAPPARVTCHHNSNIPVYNLAQLTGCSKLPSSVRQMVATRQRAKLRQDTDKQINYIELWADQWELETGEKVDGIELQNNLHQMQARPSVKHRLKQFIVTQADMKDNTDEKENEEIDLDSYEFEAPVIGHRSSVFPRIAGQALDILVRRKVGEDYEKESWVETLGHSRLGLPIVTGVREVVDEEGIKFKPKVTYLYSSECTINIQGDPSPDGLYCCPHLSCGSQFQNYNNFMFHLNLHKNSTGPGSQETFGQAMTAYRLCSELVTECLDNVF